jgi:hypothetical protein
MRLYLHIGPHKTGTTAIQRFFHVNRDLLKERGLLYPLSGRPEKPGAPPGGPRRLNHHPLAAEILSPPDDIRDSAWPNLLAELREAKEEVALLSSELFDHVRTEGHFDALRSHLHGLDVKVIVYLRRQDEFLGSYYAQYVSRKAGTLSFEEFRRLPEVEADYERLLSRWENAFGREALIARPYERSAFPNGDVIADICALIGVDPGSEVIRPPPGNVANPSFPRSAVNCIRMVREAGMDEDRVADLLELFKRVYRGREIDADYLSPMQRAELLEEFEESNRTVAKRYLGREDGVLFADLELPDQVAWEQRYAGGPLGDVVVSIADAHRALSQGLRPPARGAQQRRPAAEARV